MSDGEIDLLVNGETRADAPGCPVDKASWMLAGEMVRTPWPLPNVQLLVSVEDQRTADERIPWVLECPAAVRGVSYEPALGPVDFSPWLTVIPGHPSRPALDWIIVGGESGPGARPFDLAWARSTVEQCKAVGVACFVKQMGARARVTHTPGLGVADYDLPLADRAGADPAEWPADLRVREFPS